MIRLSPVPSPAELTDKKVRELTTAFGADATKSVWNQHYIKKALLEMSSGKCCYCECKVDEESTYMEVEHFSPKKKYKEKVVEWVNLLPSCKRCNINKGEHDPIAEPIVHPVQDEPKDHLELRAYRFYGKTSPGKTLVEVVKLNERDRLQLKRYQIGAKTKEELDELEDWVRLLLGRYQPPNLSRKIQSKLRGIMELGLPSQEYAATVATEILLEDSYHFAKHELEKLELWDEEFQELESALTKIAFL